MITHFFAAVAVMCAVQAAQLQEEEKASAAVTSAVHKLQSEFAIITDGIEDHVLDAAAITRALQKHEPNDIEGLVSAVISGAKLLIPNGCEGECITSILEELLSISDVGNVELVVGNALTMITEFKKIPKDQICQFLPRHYVEIIGKEVKKFLEEKSSPSDNV